jgi:hypothetical protein
MTFNLQDATSYYGIQAGIVLILSVHKPGSTSDCKFVMYHDVMDMLIHVTLLVIGKAQ